MYFNGNRLFMKSYLYPLFLGLTFTTAVAQGDTDKDRLVVLQHNKIGKTYIFDRSKKEDYNRTELTYLGILKAGDGRVFKLMISRWSWGLSPETTTRLLVFNNKNRYTGYYYIGKAYKLPDRIENNALVFDNKGSENCDPDSVTRITFTNGIPNRFTVDCKDGGWADIYVFASK